MQLFLVPYSFFVFCCWRRGVSRCKHCSKGFQVCLNITANFNQILLQILINRFFMIWHLGYLQVTAFGMLCCAVPCQITSFVSDSFVTPWTVTLQAPQSMGFSRQEYWSGLPCPSLSFWNNDAISVFVYTFPYLKRKTEISRLMNQPFETLIPINRFPKRAFILDMAVHRDESIHFSIYLSVLDIDTNHQF